MQRGEDEEEGAAGGEFPGVIDLVDEAVDVEYQRSDGTWARARGATRDNVWAIVMHQTGFSRGSDDPYDYLNVISHFVVMPNGRIIQLHPIASYLPASNGLNNGSVAVEFVGNFPSKPRSTDPDDFWRPDKFGMDQLTPAQIQAGRNLIFNLKNNIFPQRGWTLDNVLGHRQSNGSRGNDPGPDVWANIGAWAVTELGMGWGGPDFSVGSGRPIPSSWWSAPSVA